MMGEEGMALGPEAPVRTAVIACCSLPSYPSSLRCAAAIPASSSLPMSALRLVCTRREDNSRDSRRERVPFVVVAPPPAASPPSSGLPCSSMVDDEARNRLEGYESVLRHVCNAGSSGRCDGISFRDCFSWRRVFSPSRKRVSDRSSSSSLSSSLLCRRSVCTNFAWSSLAHAGAVASPSSPPLGARGEGS